jgi:hypothetical protein
MQRHLMFSSVKMIGNSTTIEQFGIVIKCKVQKIIIIVFSLLQRTILSIQVDVLVQSVICTFTHKHTDPAAAEPE